MNTEYTIRKTLDDKRTIDDLMELANKVPGLLILDSTERMLHVSYEKDVSDLEYALPGTNIDPVVRYEVPTTHPVLKKEA